MIWQLIIPSVALLLALALLPTAAMTPSPLGWISVLLGILGGGIFWLIPFPTPPIVVRHDDRSSRLWAVLPWWRTLLAAMLLTLGLTAAHNMLIPAALYDIAHVWTADQGKDGNVIVVAADTQTREAQGGEDEAVMRAQLGQTLCTLANCEPRGVLLLRIFSGETEGDSILIRGFEALGEKGIPIAYLRSPEGDDPKELVTTWQKYYGTEHEVKLSVLTLTGMTCGVDTSQGNDPITAIVPKTHNQDIWLCFGKPMHPLYSLSEFNQGVLLSNRRDPSGEDLLPEEACQDRFVILTELLGGGLVKSYPTPIAEAMPVHQFWALAIDDAASSKVVEPLPGIILGLWVILWTAVGTLVASGTRLAGMGFLVALFALVASVCLLLILHFWAGILPAVLGTILGSYITKKAWSLE